MRPLDRAADRAVLDEVLRAIGAVNLRGMLYADVFSPLHQDGLHELALRLTVQVHYAPIGEQDLEAVSAPIYGRYLMVVSTDVDDRRRQFALRHGLGHVAAGHVTEISYLRGIEARNAYMAHEERVADTFALADIFPFWLVGDLRKARSPWGAIKQALCRTLRQHTVDWPEERVADRAELRLALYREAGV